VLFQLKEEDGWELLCNKAGSIERWRQILMFHAACCFEEQRRVVPVYAMKGGVGLQLHPF
jgi:hypothetical protein